MSKRFLMMAMALGLVLCVAFIDLQSGNSSVLHVFFWLLLILLIAGVALWPSTGRDQRAELALERRGWADRIDFDLAQPTRAQAVEKSELPRPDLSRAV